jgi:TATA-binding protein-associated factor Taf7
LAYRWPHGLTPPLKHARKMRSKPSALTLPYPNARGLTREEIEAIIERLLIADKEALEVSFEVQEEEQEHGAISRARWRR